MKRRKKLKFYLKHSQLTISLDYFNLNKCCLMSERNMFKKYALKSLSESFIL